MHVYTEPIMTAVWAFPVVAGFITLPYMVYQYRRYGAILLLRTTVLYSFILYLMCAYFLTMLPLPNREEVARLTTPYLQLTPFADVVRWVEKSGFVLGDPSTWMGLFRTRDLFVMVANIVMTIPLGMYLRYYFGFSLRKTVLFSLLLSLVFELTQLSALFGLYPRPYRLCETDDLITNTLGGALGYWLAKPLMRILPSRERMNEVAYRRGAHVSVTRRVTAAVVDWALLGVLLIALLIAIRPVANSLVNNGYANGLLTLGLLYVAAVTVYFIIGEWAQKGYAPGKRLTHIRLVDDRNGGRPKLWQCVVRYSMLYFAVLPLPFVSLIVFAFALEGDSPDIPLLIVCILLMLVFAAFMVLVLISAINRSNKLPHSALSKTDNVSTLMLPEELLSKVGQSMNDTNQEEQPPAKPGPMPNG